MRKLFAIVLLGLGLPFSVMAESDWEPFYRNASSGDMSLQAWHPFYSSFEGKERWQKDYLWPLFTRKGFKDEEYARFLVLGWHSDFSKGEGRERTWVLPFYFQGTAADGAHYFALFPLGGRICEFLTRDRIDFVLFPLWARSSINEVKTTSVLWPIYSKTKGDGVERFRVFPFYGSSKLAGKYHKQFVCWPFYTSVKLTGARNPGSGFILFPLYGHVRTEHGRNQWFFPPFFRFAEGDGQRIVYAPWPFVQWSDGDVYKRYLWPLYGEKEAGTLSCRFLFWPLIWSSVNQRAENKQERFSVLPFFQSEKTIRSTSDVPDEVERRVESNYWKVWPLMSWERKGEVSRFRLLDLWPMRNTEGIERNWAPLWTLYRQTQNDGVVERRLLWGIYDQKKGANESEWSLLKGLVRYNKKEGGRTLRILFFRFGH